MMPTAEDISKGYANRNLENTLFVDQHDIQRMNSAV